MRSKQHFPNVMFGASLRPQSAALAIMLMLLFLIFVLLFMAVTAQTAQAQTFKVLHSFTGGVDGSNPWAGLIMDKAGNLYGTTTGVAIGDGGKVFRLSKKGSGWVFTPLYSFRGGNDGAFPEARVIFGPDGSLYGTTSEGGGDSCSAYGCGTVFNLRPPAHASPNVLGGWAETVLYRFSGGTDGANPAFGDLIFDNAGSLYGTTLNGGVDWGTVFQLTPSGSGWTKSVLYTFSGGSDGAGPYAGLIFDNAGNLYGTTVVGGTYGAGTVFQLMPSGSGWTENVLYSFQGGDDGGLPIAGLIFDQSGNLYGATINGGTGGGGTVFELTSSGGSWTYSLLYSFTGGTQCGPWGTLVMDRAGNLYGTTQCDGAYGQGSVFKLTPSDDTWMYTSLHDFAGSDGGASLGNVIFDANGNLYGTATSGGSHGYGVVWEITP
jgi:uncharacterized repeat protein (TIGR03803 family)